MQSSLGESRLDASPGQNVTRVARCHSRLAAAGTCVTPVQARVTGGEDAPDLLGANAVALCPLGWPIAQTSVRVELLEPFDLPLLVVWARAAPSPYVKRLRRAMQPA